MFEDNFFNLMSGFIPVRFKKEWCWAFGGHYQQMGFIVIRKYISKDTL